MKGGFGIIDDLYVNQGLFWGKDRSKLKLGKNEIIVKILNLVLIQIIHKATILM